MGRYRQKPIIVNAWVWNETKKQLNEIGCKMTSCSGHTERPNDVTNLKIQTPKGSERVKKGDYIAKTFHNSYHVYESHIFEANYDCID